MAVRVGLVTDAKVLIDYAATDESVLAHAARHLGRVTVPLPVLDEVDLLDVADCEPLDIEVLEPSLEQLLEAGAERGRLSFEDRLCLVVARDAGWRCVTNDPRLRAACDTASVPVMWGLELLLELVLCGRFPPDQALAIAEELHRISPRHITSDIVAAFSRRIEERPPRVFGRVLRVGPDVDPVGGSVVSESAPSGRCAVSNGRSDLDEDPVLVSLQLSAIRALCYCVVFELRLVRLSVNSSCVFSSTYNRPRADIAQR
jgi:hypothetical protein